MTPKHKTRDVTKSLYTNYLQRADECFHAAQTSLKAQEWTATAINAIHSSIAACDAMCIFYLGKRHAGDTHTESVSLFKTINDSEDLRKNAQRLTRLLSIKNMAEYEERLVYRSEAESAIKDCERFLDYVKDTLRF
jgi:HEPN domain-containing protein